MPPSERATLLDTSRPCQPRPRTLNPLYPQSVQRPVPSACHPALVDRLYTSSGKSEEPDLEPDHHSSLSGRNSRFGHLHPAPSKLPPRRPKPSSDPFSSAARYGGRYSTSSSGSSAGSCSSLVAKADGPAPVSFSLTACCRLWLRPTPLPSPPVLHPSSNASFSFVSR